jgi:tetratricopeptide (TPR) repeat protein
MVDADSTESAGQPGTEPSTCWICYDDDSVGGQLLRSGCACHGACAFVHLRCLVSAADASAYREDDDFWVACPTCKEMRSGPAQLGLARVRWGLVKSRPDWDYARQSACTEMAVAHIEAGDFASAQTFREELLAVDRRMHGDEHPQTVSSLTNLGKILSMRCEYGKAREIVESALRTVQESTLCQQLEAEARAQAAAETDGKVCPDGSLTAAIKMELGSIYLELGDYDKAHRHFEEAVGGGATGC